jgi:HlyD family secretion protein
MKFNRITNWAFSHRKSCILIIALLLVVGYIVIVNFRSNSGTVQYITAVAKSGVIASSVTGTGQVSASNRVDVLSEVNGDVVSISAKLGAVVSQGQVLAIVDNRNALRAVDNALLGLENAKISYEKAKKRLSDQSENSSISDLNESYESSYTAISNAIIDLPDIITGMNNIFYNPSHSTYFGDSNVRTLGGDTALSYKYDAGRMFDQAKSDFDLIFTIYKSTDVSNREELVSLVKNVHSTVKKMHTALSGTYNVIDYIRQRTSNNNTSSQISIDKNTLSSQINKLNNHIKTLSGSLVEIEDAKDSATEATLSYKTAEINVSKAEDDLRNAREDLENHHIRAPFGGIIGKVNVQAGDKISSNKILFTLVTDKKIAEVSLNEIDISKVKVGQIASITFDAINDIVVSGTVSEIDLLGTVNQGVVNYSVKISFDVKDERIKTGMSLSASIISEQKQNIIKVPNSAVKNQGNANYVEALDDKGVVVRIPVKTGITNDEYTEIISGLSEGDTYISRTVNSSATRTTTSAPSIFGGTGANRATGGTIRFQAR